MATRSIRLATVVDGNAGESSAVPFGESMSGAAAWRMWCELHLEFEGRGERLTMVNEGYCREKSNRSNIGRRDAVPSGAPYATFTDFGSERCRVPLGGHQTIETARRQFRRMWEIYNTMGSVWLETL